MLFVSFFWASFHSSCSPSLGNYYEGFYVPDPCELTYANTPLLSNAAISLGCGFIMKEIYSSSVIWKPHLFLIYNCMVFCRSS